MLIFCVNIQTTSRLFVWSCSSWSRLLNEENLSATIIYQTTVCFNMTESRCTKQLGEEMTFPVRCGRTRLVCGQLFPQRRDHTQQHVATKKSAAHSVFSQSARLLCEAAGRTLNFFRKSLRSSLSGVDGTSITLATEEMLEPDRDRKAPSQLNIMRLLLVVLSLC